jgi:rRNA maturation endonuclease Nob1
MKLTQFEYRVLKTALEFEEQIREVLSYTDDPSLEEVSEATTSILNKTEVMDA